MGYHIGLVAKLLGLSPEGLRLYERTGILESRRERNGGYRFYERLDITALLRARAYQKYGFSLREAAELLNNKSLEQVRNSCHNRECQLEEEIRCKQQLLQCLQETEKLMTQLPETLGQIYWTARPALYRFEFMKENQLLLEPKQLSVLQRWTALTPFAFPSQRNSWKALLEGRDESVAAIGLLERDASLLERPLLAAGQYYPSCPCLYTVIQVTGEEKCTEYLAPLAEFVQQKGIQVTGDPVSRAFLSLNRRTAYTRYRQVWLPIGKNT